MAMVKQHALDRGASAAAFGGRNSPSLGRGSPMLAGAAMLRGSSSLPNLPPLSVPPEQIYSKHWTTERHRLLHQHRERAWLRRKAKHGYIDFSDGERTELRRYFDALAGGAEHERVRPEELEDMLISLGLADNRREICNLLEKIDTAEMMELDFEEFLELVKSRTGSHVFNVFKAMMEGKLGDRNLNFQTVISQYRRQFILDATGCPAGPARGSERLEDAAGDLASSPSSAGGSSAPPRKRLAPPVGVTKVSGEQQEQGLRVLSNFVGLMRDRVARTNPEGPPGAESIDGSEHTEAEAESAFSTARHTATHSEESSGFAHSESGAAIEPPNWDPPGKAPPEGRLHQVFHSVLAKPGMPRPVSVSADGKSKRTLERPLSPRSIVQNVFKASGPPKATKTRATVILREVALEEGSQNRAGSKEFMLDY